jgi:isoleucyl-tRNA synthetase
MQKSKNYFEDVDPKVDFVKLENEILEYWNKNNIQYKYLNRNASSNKYFSFIDGPITANNPMGIHHAWGRTLKDLWMRYKNAQGFKQRFQNGFDCQGLWVEVEVEKELGLKNKKDIETMVDNDKEKSVEKFINLCKERVDKYSDIQTQQSKRLGYFADWDNSYYTLSDDNNYMIWKFLKTCFDNGWIKKDKDVVTWCPRCETAISQHEILTENYKDVTHDSIFVKLPIKGKSNEFLLIWTTTPWTIPANTAVAIDEKLDYSLVSDGKFLLWVAKSAVARVFGKDSKIVKTVPGNKLVGLKYSSPYDHLSYVKKLTKKESENFHIVIATDNQIMPITTEEGTGLVHTSTSTGQEDHRLGKKFDLPVVQAIDDNAYYLDYFDELAKKNAKKNPNLVIDHLQKSGWIWKILKYKHRYPTCWRCREELVWKVADEWYISMDVESGKSDEKGTFRQRMLKVAKKINWIPKFGLKRELDWLNNMGDWLISKKNRYWGLALPIYECAECGSFQVMGSKDELKEKAVWGWKEFEGHSPHKPWIDKVQIKCNKCGKAVSRIDDVGNPWLDAGIVAYSTVSRDNKASSRKNHKHANPLYLQDKKEWTNWVPADLITESFPGQFKNWFYSLIAMSTVLEDIPPTKLILGHATVLAEDGREMHKSWGNSIEFNEGAEKMGVDVMRWMFVGQNYTDNLLFGYSVADETRRRFHIKLWNIYCFFVTYANIDGWTPKGISNLNPKPKQPIDHWILSRLVQTVTNVKNHMDNFSAPLAAFEIEELVDDLSNWYIRRSRERVGPVALDENDKNHFYHTGFFVLLTLSKLLAPFIPFICESMYKNLTKRASVHLDDWPDINIKIDNKLVTDMKNLRLVVEMAHALRKEKQIPVRQPLASLTSTVTFDIPDKSLYPYLLDELNVKKWKVRKAKQTSCELDTVVTKELQEEADTRELVRSIQNERRNQGLDLSQKAVVTSSWLPESKDLLDYLKRKTSTIKLINGNELTVKLASD